MKTIGEILEERHAREAACVLFYVQKTESVANVCRHMADKDVGAVCVVDGTRLVGVFSERDAVRRVVAKGLDPGKVTVEQVMTRNVMIAQPEETYQACLDKMKQARVRHLPVVSGDRVLGMLSARELYQEQQRSRDFQLQALTDYVYHVPPTGA
jgi:CBS domain-containing protein